MVKIQIKMVRLGLYHNRNIKYFKNIFDTNKVLQVR